MLRALLGSLLLAFATACASTPRTELSVSETEGLASVVFASPDAVTVGTFRDLQLPDQLYRLTRSGDRFRFEVLDNGARIPETYHSELLARGDWFSLPGHHGFRFVQHGKKQLLEIYFCYLHVLAEPVGERAI